MKTVEIGNITISVMIYGHEHKTNLSIGKEIGVDEFREALHNSCELLIAHLEAVSYTVK